MTKVEVVVIRERIETVMWGYPEFYIPVPGGYGTESHGHVGIGRHRHADDPAPALEPKPAPSG